MLDALINLVSEVLELLGGVADLAVKSLKSLRDIKKIPGPLLEQMNNFGVNSVPIVLFTSVFTGMVTAVQIAYQIRDYAPLDLLGAGVAKMVMIELGPVLTALVIAGRMGAGIAAELGTMRVTEQIDALECMAIDPVRYLVLPRILSGIIMVPILTVLAITVAIAGAAFVSNVVVDLDYTTFFQGIKLHFVPKDLYGGLIKSVFFGLIVSLMGSYYGYYARGGATGVGKATTQAVVSSSLLILLVDYVLGVILFGK
ncbi:MAG: ABC transporter permease [Candidatus Hydrothermota bacterium]|uniref:ABC transporter permease n=1 Tax=candidate division WOR-3 bacterium TaxID=2052148 RepID=A0A7C0XA27_UNCW3|nr:MAG: ABC transporter permease [Candidatus Hydrothermae bacterium]RKZ03565.1 MAG: ABC transporter permease [Candidatus Hydrothermae bacterium]HDM90756.1 ABC transporter permease [candidate division WOR-3 bacterium]